MDGADRSGRFLLALIDAGGTVPPAMGLAAELVRRGHHVRVLGDPTMESSARSAGSDFSPWREAPHFQTRDEQTAAIAAVEGRNPVRAIRVGKAYAGNDMTSRFARDVVATIDAFPTDVVLGDLLPGILIAGQAARLPTAALLAQTYIRPTVGLPLLGTGWSPADSPLGRVRDTVAPKIASWLLARTLPRLNKVVTSYDLPPLHDVFELFDRCSRVLVMTSPSFDFTPPRLPDNVRYVGPQLDDPDWAAKSEWVRRGSEPVVLVATSSVYQDQSSLLRRIAAALGTLPVQGVLTTGRGIGPEAIRAPANVQVARALPHRRVLAEASVVITHAGHGSTLKSLAAGVPLVCIPMGRDQKDNTVRVLRLGAGVRLSQRSNPDQIAAAVFEVLANPKYGHAARRFAEVLATEASTRRNAADEAEGLLTSGSSDRG
jgi:MGT family glycosyltransferase